MSFGSRCGSRFHATVKAEAVHGFPTEASIISLSSQWGRGRAGPGGAWVGNMDKAESFCIWNHTVQEAGACSAPGWIIRLQHSKRNFFFFFPFQRCFHSRDVHTSTRHGIMSAHDRLVFANNTRVDLNQHLELSQTVRHVSNSSP